ncbi:protein DETOXIFICATION 27-like isoform X3 [Ananas comosus]|uniref:Protein DETOXIFICATION 27-like isoform X3 n=1 Tax=Ananas comosus TaxID=4615 RepID=A0A6P5GEA1_ANACO|nr:protein DETOXIFICATION 27-like isoform X3 [Ananas comosus]
MEKGEERVALLNGERKELELERGVGLGRRVWEESKQLWRIVAPAIFSRVVTYSMNVITQAFAGHLGELELASISIANTVVVGFNFGLMLGMASALETLCGQAFGAKKYHMLGVYMQRSWIVLFLCAVVLLPMYFFATPILRLLGQPPELAAQAGDVSMWLIPLHFSFAFLFPLQRFLQCQLKNAVNAVISAVALVVHVFVTWLFVSRMQLGLVGTAATLNFSCLENWYYRILILLTGNLKNAEIAVDALSVCMSINGWELMIPLAFFAGTGVRVANELGAGNGKGARFATIVSVVTSIIIGLFFCVLIMSLHDKFALIFTSSEVVLEAVDKLSILLAFTILLNSIQPVLSGVAVGSGWQALVAYVNIGSYYLIGIPLGVLMGWLFHLGVLGIWAGMIGGTAVQTLILAYLTIRCDWDKEAMKASTRMEKQAELK